MVNCNAVGLSEFRNNDIAKIYQQESIGGSVDLIIVL
jgi:hypothetical protein